jgi:hypothetical protein
LDHQTENAFSLPGRRSAAEVRRIAAKFAKLPELLRSLERKENVGRSEQKELKPSLGAFVLSQSMNTSE